MSQEVTSEQPTTLVFNLTCPEPRAWVVLNRDGTAPRVVEMWQPRDGHWSACAVVSPGDYRCRCYAGNKRMVTYCGPPQVDGGAECGMDVVVAVRGSPAPDPHPAHSNHLSEMAHV